LGTFNPGVVEYKGQIIVLYRAYDRFRISRLGLAHSLDGIEFTQYQHPVIDTDPDDPYERLGIEDPRITFIDGVYYILHSSASYHPVGRAADASGVTDHVPWRVRVGMHTTEDFERYHHWGIILPDVPAKNATLLPEKVKDSFVLYYREYNPWYQRNILKVALTRDFKSWTDVRELAWPDSQAWQGVKLGLGSQPIVTPAGYLMVYHAVDETFTYRLGLMLFSKDDPTKMLWYSNAVLEPERSWEREGYVPNVVYSCGALLRGQELWIYYGAADKVIGRAIMPLPNIL
jgi:predicted GH43/DUF377 family glycosyl hydrolase